MHTIFSKCNVNKCILVAFWKHSFPANDGSSLMGCHLEKRLVSGLNHFSTSLLFVKQLFLKCRCFDVFRPRKGLAGQMCNNWSSPDKSHTNTFATNIFQLKKDFLTIKHFFPIFLSTYSIFFSSI